MTTADPPENLPNATARRARALHEGEHNCCQAVVTALWERAGRDPADAVRMAAAFGSGMQRGEVCGAATGALMALGMRHAGADPSDSGAKKAVAAKARAFLKAFAARHGSCLCREIIRVNGGRFCGQLVYDAIELLDELDPPGGEA